MEKLVAYGGSNPLKLREIILNTRKPLILRNFGLKWKCFNISFEEWCTQFDEGLNEVSLFEMMYKDGSKSPQWERKRELREMTAVEFLQEQNKTRGCWFGLNYKRSSDLPASAKEGIELDSLGFAGVLEDFTSWLCSKEANTPCHYDTYGCNIVVQVYGKKSWLLFPPETPLTSTRIPYEESSIYCTEHFFAPGEEDILKLLKLKQFAYRCVLDGGDILIVPKHWWHYVEAIEVSLSMNYWVPLLVDEETRIEECIVKLLIESFVRNKSEDFKKYILNPNQLCQITDENEIFEILNFLYTSLTMEEPPTKLNKSKRIIYPYQYLEEGQFESILNELPKGMVEPVLQMTGKEYEKLITSNSKRLQTMTGTSDNYQPISKIQKALINSVCSPEVIKHIKNEFYKNYKL